MDDLIYEFVEYLATHKQYAANTLAAYRNDLLQLRQFILNERPHVSSWARVDPLLLQAYLLHMRARSYSAATIARKIAAIKSFYYYLFDPRALVTNPNISLDPPPVIKHRPDALTEQQVNALINAAATGSRGYRDRAMLELLYAAGLRVTELVMLTLDAVDLDNATLRVGENSLSRSLALDERATNALRAYLEKGRGELKGAAGIEPLFVNPRGIRLTRQGVWLIIKRCAKQASLNTEITPHSLRHAFVAHRLERGENAEELQRQLGHQHLTTTLAYSRARSREAAAETEA